MNDKITTNRNMFGLYRHCNITEIKFLQNVSLNKTLKKVNFEKVANID